MKCSKPLQTSARSFFILLLLLKVAFSLTLTREQFEKIAQRELKKLYPNAVLEGITLYSKRVELPDRPLVFNVEKTKGGFFLKVEDPLNGKDILTVPLKVAFKQKVPVAVRNINPGEVITHANVQFEERVIRTYERKAVAKNPFGKVAKTFIPKGSVVYKRYLGYPTVKAGKRVVVEFIKGALVIKTYGTLLDNGRIGQSVRVKKGNKVFFGRLKDENTVVVELP